MPGPSQEAPEFSRPVEVEALGAEGAAFEIEANPEERGALARRFGLLGLDRLRAEVTVAPVSRRLFRVNGRLEAEVVQSCVVTLEPVAGVVRESFSALFGEAGPGAAALLPEAEEEVPEPIELGRIDIGEVAAQHLSLGLDPYPRRPGAAVPDQYVADPPGAEERGAGPFAGLAGLRGRTEG